MDRKAVALHDERDYDYVIVGAGTAGCVLAARLTEDPDVSVCLIEAGPPDRHPFIQVPALVGAAKKHLAAVLLRRVAQQLNEPLS